MALIKCPECGKEVSDKVSACIHCGYPLTSSNSSPSFTGMNICPKLLKADGESVDFIADKIDLNRNSVLLCLKNTKTAELKMPYMMHQAAVGMLK